MNIHLPAILMFTRGTIGFDTLPCFFIIFHWILHIFPPCFAALPGKGVDLRPERGGWEKPKAADVRLMVI